MIYINVNYNQNTMEKYMKYSIVMKIMIKMIQINLFICHIYIYVNISHIYDYFYIINIFYDIYSLLVDMDINYIMSRLFYMVTLMDINIYSYHHYNINYQGNTLFHILLYYYHICTHSHIFCIFLKLNQNIQDLHN